MMMMTDDDDWCEFMEEIKCRPTWMKKDMGPSRRPNLLPSPADFPFNSRLSCGQSDAIDWVADGVDPRSAGWGRARPQSPWRNWLKHRTGLWWIGFSFLPVSLSPISHRHSEEEHLNVDQSPAPGDRICQRTGTSHWHSNGGLQTMSLLHALYKIDERTDQVHLGK